METFFNPMGRIGPVTFRNAALILVAVGAVFGLMPLAGLTMLSFASLLLLYPWAVIWVKRLHDAGKSGKLFLGVFAVWFIVNFIANYFVSRSFAPPVVRPANPADVDVWATMTAQSQAIAVPATIAAVIIALAFALLINEQLKSDPEVNQYGSPPAP